MARRILQIPAFTLVTGGQTGVDRAALDVGLSLGIAVDGWCPRGRRAADGIIADHYPLRETPSGDYAERTTWNVRDSDALLILGPPKLTGGTALAEEIARRYCKPVLHVVLDPSAAKRRTNAEQILHWLLRCKPEVLNIAGPRESDAPGAYDSSHELLTEVLPQYLAQKLRS